MDLSTEALARHIRLGEDGALAFRSVSVDGPRVRSPPGHGLADELAALANSRGGTLVLGVNDAGAVEGISHEHLDGVERWVRRICTEAIKPPLDADVAKLQLADAAGTLEPVLRIDVPRSLFTHESPGGHLRRIGSSKRKMSSDALARSFQDRSQSGIVRHDQTLVPGTRRSDLDYALTARLLHRDAVFGDSQPTDDLLRKLRIIGTNRDGALSLTLAGTLLCTKTPQRWLPHAYIQAVNYAGERTDEGYQVDAQDIGGPLDAQIVDALHFVRRTMLAHAANSTDHPQFSERAVFEALVNAVAHRDYALAGMHIRLHLFSDRLELHVPGALPTSLTPDNLHLLLANRNELIASLLARCRAPSGLGRTRMMDRRGDGVPIILREGAKLARRFPTYSLVDDAELCLIMWAQR